MNIRARFDTDAPVRPDDDPLTMARAFRQEYAEYAGTSALCHFRGEFYLYDERVYNRLWPECLRSDIYHFLELQRHWRTSADGTRRIYRYRPNTRRVNEVLDALTAVSQVKVTEMPCWLDGDQYRPEPRNVIAFNNGLLDVAGFLQDGEPVMLAPTPQWFSETLLPYDFDPNARCDAWCSFLQEVLSGDCERLELLQEWMGYCLTADTSQQKALLMLGPPRSGKGTVIRTIQRVIGQQNCASVTLSTLCERFGLWPLLGKRVAVCPDAHLGRGADAVGVLEKLKSIVGEDAQSVDRKNREPLANVRIGVRFTIAVNEIPRLPDSSLAMRSRLLLMPLNNTYEGREDRGLDSKLAQETPGILLWSLAGLLRLRLAGRFTEPRASRDLMRHFTRLSSPVSAFIEDCCEIRADLQVPVETLWKAWKQWCDDNGSCAGSKATFGEHLRAGLPSLSKRRLGADGERRQVYAGLALAPHVTL